MKHTPSFRLILSISVILLSSAAYGQMPLLPPPAPPNTPGIAPLTPMPLDDLILLGLSNHPRLAQSGLRIEAARGKALQAGLPMNPVFSFSADELGDRTGPMGILAPSLSQEFVRGGKLKISRIAASKEIDQATHLLQAETYQLVSEIRQAYFDVVVLERRNQLLLDLVKLADASVATTEKLLNAKQIARLDLVQLEVEQERLRADQEAVEREITPAYRRLAAVLGVPATRIGPLRSQLDDPIPDYNLDQMRELVVGQHPERLAALSGVEKSQWELRRAKVEPVPNITLSAGYVRQGQNRSNDWMIGISSPIPVWNKNQGGIQTANAHLAEAVQEVRRIEADLSDRLATAFGNYLSARKRAERYYQGVLPKAKETYELSLKAYQGGQFEYLRVIEAQRTYTQAVLDYVKSLGDAWKAAAVISGLTLEDQWPPPAPIQVAAPAAVSGQEQPQPLPKVSDQVPEKLPEPKAKDGAAVVIPILK